MKFRTICALTLALVTAKLSAQEFEVKPRFELSKTDYSFVRPYTNTDQEFFISVGLEAKLKFSKDNYLFLGGDSQTYCDFVGAKFPYVNPTSQKYTIFGGWNIGDFQIFAEHYCQHPVIGGERYGYLLDNPVINQNINEIRGQYEGRVNITDIAETRIGIRYNMRY